MEHWRGLRALRKLLGLKGKAELPAQLHGFGDLGTLWVWEHSGSSNPVDFKARLSPQVFMREMLPFVSEGQAET